MQRFLEFMPIFNNIYAFANFVGLIGVILILWAYFASQYGLWQPDHTLFLVFNLLGSILLIYSLLYHWNLSSFIIEIVWIAITLFGFSKKLGFSKKTA